ncbi:MAG: FtsQ-type POTRA domain-containing protein [Clostridia bacterium]|nr:FtsQ-type POTRA domain-containing protein [Clostridia bacterium]MBQ1965548.1 FtsQ-type POTRA domain-containing protein [Clostridia bacterium]MBQ5742973.1 FtsQ-type POTRA domain-containing protein [Clostridia bacterium]
MKSEMERLREKQQRRRQKHTLRILIISPFVALIFVVALSFLTRINTVVVHNSTRYSSVEIANQFDFSVGDSLFTVHREALADQITVSCPYVKSAEISYRLPNDLQITLTPATAVMAVRTEAEVLLLDEDFKVLEVVDRLPEGMMSVDGLELTSYTVGYPLNEEENLQVSIVRELFSELTRRNLLEHVSKIDLSKKYNISMKIYDVIDVYLGNSEQFDAKMNVLVKILNENDVTVPAEIRVRNPAQGRYARLETTDLPSSNTTTDSESANSSATDKNTDNS